MSSDKGIAVKEVESTQLIAMSAADMPEVQANLIGWLDKRVADHQDDLDNIKTNLDIAKKNKWRQEGLKRAVKMAEKLMTYYEKVRAAVKEGCVIMPPFPGMEVFAIRTNRKGPVKNTGTWHHEQSGGVLPQGKGEYRSADPEVYEHQVEYEGRDGKTLTKRETWAENYRDVAFPVALVKPQIMEATSRAMAMKLFDEIGILPVDGRRRGNDPIIMAKINDPRPSKDGIYFFLAWWLDPETI